MKQDLRQRTITAICLLVGLTLFCWLASPLAITVMLVVITAAILLEFIQLINGSITPVWLGLAWVMLIVVLWGLVYAANWPLYLLVATIAWCLMQGLLLQSQAMSVIQQWCWSIVYFIALAFAGVVIIGAVQVEPQQMLVAMVSVWAFDIGCYFAGRRWGRHRLAPMISPGKTWEGYFGGVGAACATAWSFSGWLTPGSLIFLLLGLLWLPLTGDLQESFFKRLGGKKDSGSWLPGHGGLLDRVDGLLPLLAWFSWAVFMQW